jgi:sortase A
MSRSGGDRLRLALRGTGQVLITAGVIILLFVAYELWITNLYTDRQQGNLKRDIQAEWRHPTPSPTPGIQVFKVHLGDGLAILRIPRLGRTYAKVIVEGVGTEDLKRGPGHYPGTAMPGGVGNFVVSGHRTTYGAPFNRLDEMHRGDPIVIETRDTWFVYDVTSIEVVKPTDVAVIAPVPDHPGRTPTAAMLTFTTCNPKYSARQRLIVHGRLVDRQPKTEGAPSVLGA